jgi:hypothetical protein
MYAFTVSGDTGGIAPTLLGMNDNYAGAWLMGSCEECDEPLGSIKCREFLDCTNNYLITISFSKKGCVL